MFAYEIALSLGIRRGPLQGQYVFSKLRGSPEPSIDLDPTPYTINPTPETLNPKPFSILSEPTTRIPKPSMTDAVPLKIETQTLSPGQTRVFGEAASPSKWSHPNPEREEKRKRTPAQDRMMLEVPQIVIDSLVLPLKQACDPEVRPEATCWQGTP